MKKLLYSLLLALTGLAAQPAADFSTGLAAYEKGDYATALKQWEPLAKAGSSAAQYNLGLLYFDGKGVPRNFNEAAKFFEQAADRNYAPAQHNLGALYALGQGVKRDYGQAYKWLSLCAAAGDPACAAQRDLVAKKIKSASKLAAAQRATREWKPKPAPEPANK